MAVVAYMIILQWQEDYSGAPQARQAQELAQQMGDQPETFSQQALQNQDVPLETNSGAEDVPVAPVENAAQLPQQISQPAQGIIHVDTDVFKLRINPVGGDIVHVGLKDYPVSLDQPDIPFTLLDSNPSHTYVAQSGLIGPNGPDASKTVAPIIRLLQPDTP